MARYLSIDVFHRDTGKLLTRFFYNISITDIKNLVSNTDTYEQHEQYFRLTTVPLKVVYSTVEYKDIRKSEPKYKAIEPYEKSSFRKPGNMSEKSAERKLDDKDIALLRTIL